MKRNILRVLALSLLVSTSFVILIRLSNAQDSRNENSNTIPTQAAPPEKTLEQVRKNIQVLNGMPQSQLYPAMRFMAASLGVNCGFCHAVKNGQLDSPSDDNPEKRTARDMIKMVVKINMTLGKGEPEVSCYTCHRGRTSPQGFPTLPLPLPSPLAQRPAVADASQTSPNTRRGLPSADDVLSRYLTAIGGQTASDRIKSCLIKGTSETLNGEPLAYETDQSVPDKGYESFITQGSKSERVINGPRGWLKNADGVQELLGQQLADQKLSFPLFVILKLKDQYSSVRVSGQDKIDDRDAYVVGAIRLDNKRERLYFDVESGLLIRRISYTRTMIGAIPEQTDFEDYREVEGLKLPFTITTSFVDSRSPIVTRKFTEIKLNITLDESKFDKPLPKNATVP